VVKPRLFTLFLLGEDSLLTVAVSDRQKVDAFIAYVMAFVLSFTTAAIPAWLNLLKN